MPRNVIARGAFQKLGIAALFRHDELNYINLSSVKGWIVATGSDAEPEIAEATLECYNGLTSDPNIAYKRAFYAGVIEAITNVNNHAFREQEIARWWLSHRIENGVFTVVFCDYGLGIPATLLDGPQRKSFLERLKIWLNVPRRPGSNRNDFRDVDLIEAAIELGSSRTKENHRGKGLPQIVEVIKAHGVAGSHITIHSGQGTYFLKNDGSEPTLSEHRAPLQGTLISWSLPL